MLTLRKAAAMICCFGALLCLVGCNGQGLQTQLFIADEDTNVNAPILEATDLTPLADNGVYTMEYDPSEERVNFRLKATDELLWSTGLTAEEYGQNVDNKMTLKALKQLVNLKYTDFGKRSGAIHNVSNACETTLRRIDNGIRFDFDFEDYDIKLSLELQLGDDGFTAYIPKNSVKEDGKFAITGLDILPMLAATPVGKDGYIFLPDGSGALYQFGKPAVGETMLSLDVYDDMLVDLDKAEDNAAAGRCKASAPVFGIKQGDKALFANMTVGEENCSIILQTDGGVYKASRVHAAARVRKQYAMKAASGSEVYAYEKENYISDIRIDFTFINGENCGYSEMAAVYRSYLLANDLLKTTVTATEAYPVAVDFLVSMQKDAMLFNETVTTASFEQIAQMLQRLTEQNVFVSNSVLYGWQKNGYNAYPSANAVSSAAGGKSKLSELFKSADKTNFYLLQNYMNATLGQKGFSTYTDVVYKIDNVPLTDEEEEKYLLNLSTRNGYLQKDIALCEKLGAGIAAEGFGSLLYEDYEKTRRVTRYGFKQQVSDMLKTIQDAGVSAATDGFAPYLLGQTDYIFNLTAKSSQYMLLDQDVPFIQMVLHGHIAYSDAAPGNLSGDLVQTKLKWIEYGYMPTFMLTYQNSDRLKDTSFDLLFSSEYTLWESEIVAMGKEFSERLASVFTSEMVSHQKQDGVATVQYANGKKVIVNYNDTDITVDGVSVKAQDYIVI